MSKAILAELIGNARRLVAGDTHNNCWSCMHDVDVCDCALAKLRHAVLTWDESATMSKTLAGWREKASEIGEGPARDSKAASDQPSITRATDLADRPGAPMRESVTLLPDNGEYDEGFPGECRHSDEDNTGICAACIWQRCRAAEARAIIWQGKAERVADALVVANDLVVHWGNVPAGWAKFQETCSLPKELSLDALTTINGENTP